MTPPGTQHPYVTARFEHQIEMVRPSRERAAAGPLPPGYTSRAFRDGDDAAYQELFHLAWPDDDEHDGALAHTKRHALEDGFVVVEDEATSQLVASCVAFAPETPRHADDGSLGWLVVDPAHGGRGLGRFVAAAVTNRLIDEGYALPWLGTEDDRLVAIGIYLSLGWEPHLYIDGMTERWVEIMDRLRRDTG